ncbi:hypothetical protein HCK45_004270 [Salmonella enterica]|nr:hypothetical protein [Salmonella enterica]HAU6859858.1 hypothetical protein [Salmonella enterica subsp. enterica serovar Senftenberg]EGO0473564.1 hypothetical protein [Salmonella enterica]EGO0789204.1 hypothetical protein [Salmonella enterica]EHC8783737.1 hypothetical protein [Salmonella enterica]
MSYIDKVFPAPAGINHKSLYRSVGLTRVPRASGDKPLVGITTISAISCSPRQRG